MGLVPNPEDARLIEQKQAQAIEALQRRNIDAWVLFVREGGEPIMTSLLAGPSHIVQNAVFVFTADGRKIALLEPIDVQNGAGTFFDEVRNFSGDVGEPLRKLWKEIDPQRIALNYSRTHYAADGLTHGMFLRLRDALGDLGLEQRMVPSEEIVSDVRAVKSDEERERLRTAAEITIELAGQISTILRPGVTDNDIAALVREQASRYGASGASISTAINPAGQNVKGPRGQSVQAGETLVSDMGAIYKGYRADIKRMWYVADGNGGVPSVLVKQWEACRASLETGLRALRPGRPGYEVHEEAWGALEAYGYPRDKHSYGHQIGREAHDAGPWLGDRGNPYRPAEGRLAEGMVVTLDPTMNRVGISDEALYCMGIEEMAEVTAEGGRLLHEPQEEIMVARF